MSESIELTDKQVELLEEYANAEPVTEELQARIDADSIVKKVIKLIQSCNKCLVEEASEERSPEDCRYGR